MTEAPTPNTSGNYVVVPAVPGTGAGDAAPVLLPPGSTWNAPGAPITLPLLWQGSAASFPDPSNADFGLAIQPDPASKPGPAQTAGQVVVTLRNSNMWRFDSQSRAQLAANFDSFLANVEAALELPQLLIPGSTERIRQVIAARLPALLGESLYYRYAMSAGTAPGSLPYVDVRPGMQLRVDLQSSQFVAPGSGMNGYVSSGSFRLRVGSAAAADGSRVVAFDPFLASIKSPVITGAPTAPAVAGGVIDLQPVGGARAHWRLFYPGSMAAPSAPGGADLAGNVALVGAPTLQALNAATAAFPAVDPGGAPPNVYAVFLGRAIAVPEIPIWVAVGNQQSLEYVEIGTTLGNVIERFTYTPIDPVATAGLTPLLRIMPGPTNNPTPALILQTSGLPFVPRSMWDVPLAAGDVVTVPTR